MARKTAKCSLTRTNRKIFVFIVFLQGRFGNQKIYFFAYYFGYERYLLPRKVVYLISRVDVTKPLFKRTVSFGFSITRFVSQKTVFLVFFFPITNFWCRNFLKLSQKVFYLVLNKQVSAALEVARRKVEIFSFWRTYLKWKKIFEKITKIQVFSKKFPPVSFQVFSDFFI